MSTRDKTPTRTRNYRTCLAVLGTAVGGLSLWLTLSGCGPLLQTLAEDITGIPLAGFPTPTQIPTQAPTAVPTAAGTATATPTSVAVLFNATISGNSSVVAPATYPTGFFIAGQDISNSTTGEGSVTPYSSAKPIQIKITGNNTASRPQIQFQDSTSLAAVFTNSPQNTGNNTLSTSFTPANLNKMNFSVIDTGVAASGQGYIILIQQ